MERNLLRAELKQDGEVLLVELHEVEDGIRRARLYGAHQLRYRPWTGDTFSRLDTLPDLAPFFQTREARFAAWVRQRRIPGVTAVLFVVIMTAGVLQFMADVWSMTAGGPSPVARMLAGAVGFDSLLLDGRWWTPWTSQLLHSGLFHVAMNLPIVAYCAFRVERALGPAATCLVAASSMAMGTVLVTVLSELPVVGSSIVAYGLWGAQIAIGLRMGDALPREFRGFYGWGNLVIFIPLTVLGLGAEGVSHMGHFGGLLGGVLAASLVTSESMVQPTRVLRRVALNVAFAAMIAVLPGVLGIFVSQLPAVVGFPWEDVEVDDGAVTLSLPSRMVGKPLRFNGLDAWITTGNATDDPVFCGVARYYGDEPLSDDVLAEDWSGAGEIRVLPPPPTLGEGWEGHTFELLDPDTGEVTRRIVEHDRQVGQDLVRIGYALSPGSGSAREALYREILGSVRVRGPARSP